MDIVTAALPRVGLVRSLTVPRQRMAGCPT